MGYIPNGVETTGFSGSNEIGKEHIWEATRIVLNVDSALLGDGVLSTYPQSSFQK